MPLEVVLPKVDMDMESGVLVEWRVSEGDRVRQGDILFDMETNKAVMEVESPASGTIRGLTPITGEPITVGVPVAWIYRDNESETVSARGPSTSDVPIAPPTRSAHVPPLQVPTRSPSDLRASPRDAVRATPSARSAARELNVDLATITGSGPGGRIIEKDVRTAADRQAAATAALPSAAESTSEGRLIPFNSARRIAAKHLSESMRNAPHFYLSAQIEMTALLDVQKRLMPSVAQAAGIKPSVTLLLAYILGRVLIHHLMVNASIEGDTARLHRTVNIGIAMDRSGDLIVPVLHNAQARTLVDLAREFAQLRAAAERGTIQPAQMRGGTFTLSNLGMYGVDAFTAIINSPESAILAVGRTVAAPVGRDGQIVLLPMAIFSLSSDHRIIDGVTAARFMADLRKAVESPDIPCG